MSEFTKRHSVFHPHGLMWRETGLRSVYGIDDAKARSLYCGMKPIASWDCENACSLPTGGIFNLEFSPEGSLLVAACEKKSIQIFDPLTHSRIHSVNGAHSDCVNCVKFLDNRMFATCSDDTTIGLWDVRNLKKKILTLHGHSNWVKNIEFSVKDKLLVTSGLDGSIYTWDINSYTECSLVYRRVFHASGLMRCRLSPDAQQMVMCTTGGLLVIVHDLDLSELHEDLNGFKPNLYRLMQRSKQLIPIAAVYNYLFDKNRNRNRIEFVADFPKGNDAEVVSSLQIHPQGWTALSRNISHDDKSEWTCIHDIQPEDPVSDKSVRDSSPELEPMPSTMSLRHRAARRARYNQPQPDRAEHIRTGDISEENDQRPRTSVDANTSDVIRYNVETVQNPGPSREGASGINSSVLMGDDDRDEFERRRLARLRVQMTARFSRENRPMRDPETSRLADGSSVIQIRNDVWEASMTIRQSRILQAMASRGQLGRNFNMQHIIGINTGIASPTPPAPPYPGTRRRRARAAPADAPPAPPARPAAPAPPAPPLTVVDSPRPSTSGQTPDQNELSEEEFELPDKMRFVRQNKDRLLYYIEETNEGKGFIKELCYSADGRIVCSPFGNGVRLLALNKDCMELSHCVAETEGPRTLVEVGRSLGIHRDLVVSAKFSPRHHLLVTGCLAGKIVWYEPHTGKLSI